MVVILSMQEGRKEGYHVQAVILICLPILIPVISALYYFGEFSTASSIGELARKL
jgi:hypothetical protein